MSNIHRLNDLRNRNENNQQNGQNIRRLMTTEDDIAEARTQSFMKFLSSFFCKNWKPFSFTALSSLILVVIYISCLCFGIESSDKKFLVPKRSSSLMSGLFKDTFDLRNGEIWRWITYSLLHNDFQHICFNLLTLTIFGSLLEALILWKKIGLISLISGVLGGLMSSLVNPNVITVGASVCIYGIIGGYVSSFKYKL